LGELPFSKELFPIDVSEDPGHRIAKPVIEFLLENMRGSGIRRAGVVIRDGKWDIPGHLGDGSRFGLALAYFIMGRPFGVPYSLDQAYDHVRDSDVALGFPDIVLCLPDAFARCLDVQHSCRADVVLGGFPADHPPGVDMLDIASDGRVNGLVVKPEASSLSHTWGLATWSGAFTDFMHELLAARPEADAAARELHVADVFNEAIAAGLHVRAEILSDQPFVDIGTPQGLARFMDNRSRHLSRTPARPDDF
jgi:glucose-1-phosphate thymidylyltransferase